MYGVRHGHVVGIGYGHPVVTSDAEQGALLADAGLLDIRALEAQHAFLAPGLHGIHFGARAAADAAVMHKSEMREVHEVLQAPGRAGFPVIYRASDEAESRIVKFGECRRCEARVVVKAEPDDAAGLGHGIASDAGLHHLHQFVARWNLHASSQGVVAPAVVWAFELAVGQHADR